MQLALNPAAARGTEEERLVEDAVVPVIHDRDGAGHDVETGAPGQIAHRLAETRRVAGQLAHLFGHRPAHVAQREQLCGEVLREHNQLDPVIPRRPHERRNLVAELLEPSDGADVVLQSGNPDSVHSVAPVIESYENVRPGRPLAKFGELPREPETGEGAAVPGGGASFRIAHSNESKVCVCPAIPLTAIVLPE